MHQKKLLLIKLQERKVLKLQRLQILQKNLKNYNKLQNLRNLLWRRKPQLLHKMKLLPPQLINLVKQRVLNLSLSSHPLNHKRQSQLVQSLFQTQNLNLEINSFLQTKG